MGYPRMKINWKHLSYALMCSIIVNGLVFGQIYRIYSYKKVIGTSSLPIPQAFLMSNITKHVMTIAFDNSMQSKLPYILFLGVSFVILIIVFYFVIGHIKKIRK